MAPATPGSALTSSRRALASVAWLGSDYTESKMTAPKRKLAADLMRAGMLVALTFGIVTAVSAATLDDYKARIESARTLASQIQDSIQDDEERGSQTGELATHIRRDFPASERIEWEGGTVETANQWLLDKAGAIEGQKDPQKQRLLVSEIREYLSTVSLKLHELEKMTAAERSKDTKSRRRNRRVQSSAGSANFWNGWKTSFQSRALSLRESRA